MRCSFILRVAIISITLPVSADGPVGRAARELILVTPLGLNSEEWEVIEDNEFPTTFHKRGTDLQDLLVIQDLPIISEDNLDDFHQLADGITRDLCKKVFSSDVLDKTPINGYPRVMWKTQCIDNFEASTTLNIAIKGNARFYHVMKGWPMGISDRELSDWRKRFSGISVCDSRIPTRPCPSGSIPILPLRKD